MFKRRYEKRQKEMYDRLISIIPSEITIVSFEYYPKIFDPQKKEVMVDYVIWFGNNKNKKIIYKSEYFLQLFNFFTLF